MPFLLAIAVVVGALSALHGASPSGPDYVQVGCNIFDEGGRLVARKNGARCIFFDDGAFLTGDEKRLALFDPNGNPIWSLPMHTHHLLTETSDGKFLVGSSETREIGGQKIRFDVIHRIGRRGTIERTFRFADHIREFEPVSFGDLPLFRWNPASDIRADYEFTHMNSYYEIPKNPTAVKIPAFNEGNVIVNSIGPGRLMILSKDLDRILWKNDLREIAGSVNFHDVQVLPNGHLLMFENLEHGRENSTLIEYDPSNKKIVWRYRAEPPSSFNLKATGGVQRLADGSTFFGNSTIENAAYLIGPDGKIRKIYKFGLGDDEDGKLIGFQDAKLRALGKFLSKNRGL